MYSASASGIPRRLKGSREAGDTHVLGGLGRDDEPFTPDGCRLDDATWPPRKGPIEREGPHRIVRHAEVPHRDVRVALLVQRENVSDHNLNLRRVNTRPRMERPRLTPGRHIHTKRGRQIRVQLV